MATTATASELGRFLDAIVDLTRQHDLHELQTALLGAIRASVRADRVRLYALSNADGDSEFNESNIRGAALSDRLDAEFGEPRPLAGDTDLVSCVCSRNPVSREVAGRRRTVFPVFGAHHVRALLMIEGAPGDTVSHELLAKVLHVYSNQALMLSRAERDALTGLYNRQSFDDRMRRAAQRDPSKIRAADAAGVCFALFDIDHFKQVNDQFGHLYGDEMLILLARLMTRSFRHEDQLFRYGGEEFAVVLANVDLEIAGRVLERFRNTVAAYAFPQIGHKTVSIGFTKIDPKHEVETAVLCADTALYYAKNHGRNQTHCYETLIAEAKLEPVRLTKGDVELF